jgi:hypothetical protein
MVHTYRRCFALTSLAATAALFGDPVVAAPRHSPAGIATASDPIILAQGGSTGGSIGKSDKSIGGESSPPPPSSPPPSSRQPAHREAPPPSRARRDSGSGGGGGNYDGAWAVISIGCGGSSTSAVIITSGRVVGEGLTGRVSGGGSVSATWHGNGVTSYSSGRLSGRSGSGSFRRTDGCSGRWTAVKQ